MKYTAKQYVSAFVVMSQTEDKATLKKFVNEHAERLTRSGQLGLLKKIIDYVDKHWSRLTGETTVKVWSRQPLSAAQKKTVISWATEQAGSPVVLEERLDEQLIGGVKIRVGDRETDLTLDNQLTKLRSFISTSQE